MTIPDKKKPMICEGMKLAYFPAPKVANTTIKHMLHEAEYGAKFKTEVIESTGQKLHIHKKYPTPYWDDEFRSLTEGYIRVAVVRSPVDRIVSVYRNRAVHYRELSTEKASAELMEAKGLRPDPSLDEFITNLDGYRSVKSSIKVHSDPLVSFLGDDPEFYHLIVDISQIGRISSLIYALSGEKIELGKFQTGGPSIDKSVLSNDQVERIRKFYSKDIEVFGKYFSDGEVSM